MVAASLSIVVGFVGFRGAFWLREWPATSLIVFAAALAGSAALWIVGRKEQDVLPASRLHARISGSRLARVMILTTVFIAACATSAVHRRGLSTAIAPDTATYWSTPTELISPKPDAVPTRTPLYSILFAVVQLFGGSGNELLLVQIALRALAAVLVAWVLMESSVFAGSVLGLMLALDPISAATSVTFLSESLHTSLVVISVAVAVRQLTRKRPVEWRSCFVAGVVFGCAFLFRPTGAALIVAVIPIYALVTRSVSKAAGVAAGYGLVVSLIALFNYVRSGTLVVVTTGVYMAFPLFLQNLMSPNNGPASLAIHNQLRRCDPRFDYSTVTLNTSNEFVLTKLSPCLLDMTGGNQREVMRLYSAAYREAAIKHPALFARRMLLESSRFLATTASYYLSDVAFFSQSSKFEEICAGQKDYELYPRELLVFVCPMPSLDPVTWNAIVMNSFKWRMVYQPYLLAYSPRFYVESYVEAPVMELAGEAAVVFFIFALAVSRPANRPLVAAATLVIVYTAVMTALGQITIRRYVAPLSPFFLLVTGLLLVSVIEDLIALLGLPIRARVNRAGNTLVAGRT